MLYIVTLTIFRMYAVFMLQTTASYWIIPFYRIQVLLNLLLLGSDIQRFLLNLILFESLSRVSPWAYLPFLYHSLCLDFTDGAEHEQLIFWFLSRKYFAPITGCLFSLTHSQVQYNTPEHPSFLHFSSHKMRVTRAHYYSQYVYLELFCWLVSSSLVCLKLNTCS